MENLEIQITGNIQSSNFTAWKESLLKQIDSTNVQLTTDNDYAIATNDVKALKNAEKTIKEAKTEAIRQTTEINILFKALDEASEKARQTRLTLERQIRAKKQDIKNKMIECAIGEVNDHIASKPDIFKQMDHGKYLHRHQYNSAIKGKSTLNTVKKSLTSLVQNIKASIDEENLHVIKNLSIIESIPMNHKPLFQDINYLITLPDKELRLTIENRIVKISEHNARRNADEAEKELNAITNETLHGTPFEDKNSYVISIELFSSRQDAIEIAREVKNHLIDSDFLVDIKLSRKRNT